MTDKAPMTVEGEKALRLEHEHLTTNVRIRLSKEIAAAREFGDLKENAEYHAAKEQQGLTESRIREIESKLTNSQVIDVTSISPLGKVIFGVTLTLFDLGKDEEVVFKIVGEDEANVNEGKISYSSPLARSLIGKSEGDVSKFESPSGPQEYEIVSIKHI
ncbi:MAG: transcription elongation factor GreA [Gammaproteobacteria bacterium]|jgi:transcription elongation factor GreA|nr:MAG: transcription elongation factor GreA [Gammaproteobacteria bacterium]|tara:strand:+ start:632 stop:1111 length:480 start_codon:yes stop_codon:yes gene_type:complete